MLVVDILYKIDSHPGQLTLLHREKNKERRARTDRHVHTNYACHTELKHLRKRKTFLFAPGTIKKHLLSIRNCRERKNKKSGILIVNTGDISVTRPKETLVNLITPCGRSDSDLFSKYV